MADVGPQEEQQEQRLAWTLVEELLHKIRLLEWTITAFQGTHQVLPAFLESLGQPGHYILAVVQADGGILLVRGVQKVIQDVQKGWMSENYPQMTANTLSAHRTNSSWTTTTMTKVLGLHPAIEGNDIPIGSGHAKHLCHRGLNRSTRC